MTRLTTNPNPTYVSLTKEEDLAADLEQARTQIATLKSERDDMAHKINSLDKEIAKLRDDNAKFEMTKQNLFRKFQDLYNAYQQLYDQVISSNTALTITSGKLAESLVRCKFILPQQEQSET